MNMNKWKVATIILALVSIVLAVVVAKDNYNTMTSKAATAKAMDYVNKYLVSSGQKATLSKIDGKVINKLYKFDITLGGQQFVSYVSADGKDLFTEDSIDITKNPSTSSSSSGPAMTQKASTDAEGGFKEITEVNVCKENDKPIVYFFGSAGCPHCQWEKPILEGIVKEFGSAILFHENIDSSTDQDIFTQYSTGSVPTLVIGCKYYRVGSGEAQGEAAEKTALTKVICRATGNQPASVCK